MMKICVVTGSRADYGLLFWLMKEIQKDRTLRLLTVATGSHLSEMHGSTYREILKDGFRIDRKVPILTSDSSPAGITQAMGRAVLGFADVFKALCPDWLVILGDRYEILAAAEAALIARIPVAHLAGGDLTAGAMDDAIRHAITKMSHLHFVTHGSAARRVRQLGEDPGRIFNAGHIGLDGIRQLSLLSRQQFSKCLKFALRPRNLLVTFHPATLDATPSIQQLEELLVALERLGPKTGLIFTASNADSEGLQLNRRIKAFVSRHKNACFVSSMGQRLYLSALKHVDVVVGNSSSGIYEAPSFKKPTVNIGTRQEGRVQAGSILNCGPHAGKIHRAILKAFSKNCSRVVNPYGDGRTAPRILRAIKKFRDLKKLLKKRFCEI